MHCLKETKSHYHKSIPSIVREKNWNIKDDKGKSMMLALYVLWFAKGTSQDKVTSNSEELSLWSHPLLNYPWLKASVSK